MSEIERLLVEFTNNVANKIKKLQTDLDSVRAELKSAHDLSAAVETLNAKIDQIKTDLANAPVPAPVVNVPAVPVSAPVVDAVPTPAPTPLVVIESNNAGVDDLTKLPAYKYAAAFKEVRRPISLNELYMMVLQSQHNIYELQMNTDNILRRS